MRDYEKAGILGKRAFYERYTDTIRLFPENYCVAVIADLPAGKKWVVYRNEGATKEKHGLIKNALDTWQNGSTRDALAEVVGELFKSQKYIKTEYGWKWQEVQ